MTTDGKRLGRACPAGVGSGAQAKGDDPRVGREAHGGDSMGGGEGDAEGMTAKHTLVLRIVIKAAFAAPPPPRAGAELL